ncbi:hypothetical protein EVAR_44744_1 [Eumeta japonica]|uniref:Uncharacterized protein n=1 Tax=Eumeta variegata TaxID=151549 RepID=A0A4C1XJ21_EUMVA|nr:hypothetical protein EVAR_44744_1 [Eumeta japonica]
MMESERRSGPPELSLTTKCNCGRCYFASVFSINKSERDGATGGEKDVARGPDAVDGGKERTESARRRHGSGVSLERP